MCIRPVIKAMTGEKISPLGTPREMLKVSEHSSLLGFRIWTHPDAALSMVCMILRSFTDAPAELNALSRNEWLTVSNAAL